MIARMALKRSIGRLRGLDHHNCLDQDAPSWEERARDAVALCCRHLPPAESVQRPLVFADLGCGNRRVEQLLRASARLEYEYHGYDLHPQSRHTARLDLERELPPGHVDFALTLGVLEYLSDVPNFLCRVRRYATRIVVSYVVTDSPVRLTRSQREQIGWCSHYTAEQMGELLAEAGFQVEEAVRTIHDTTGLWLAADPASV